MSTIKERIIQFIESQGIKKGDFYDSIGITSANFRGAAKETPLNSSTIENIITIYPKINLQWLITGKGEMLDINKLSNNQKIAWGYTELKTEPDKPLYMDNEIVESLKDLIRLQRQKIDQLESELQQKEKAGH